MHFTLQCAIVICWTIAIVASRNASRVSHWDPMVDVFPIVESQRRNSGVEVNNGRGPQTFRNADAEQEMSVESPGTGKNGPSPGEINPEFDVDNGDVNNLDSGAERHVEELTSVKRDVNGRVISISGEQVDLHRFHVSKNELRKSDGDDQCALTYVMPHDIPDDVTLCISSQAQVTSSRRKEESPREDAITNIYNQGRVYCDAVMQAKTQMERTRNEIMHGRSGNPKEMTSLQKDVNYLKQESRITNDRVSQQHTQMMHEIVNMRDHRLEIVGLENRLLNTTVQYYTLKDEHARLSHAHNILQSQVQEMDRHMSALKRTVEQLVEANERQSIQNFQHITPRQVTRIVNHRQNAQTPISSKSKAARSTRRKRRKGPFRDCSQVQRSGHTSSGPYNLKLPNVTKKIRVWCDLDQDPGGWIVIQRRQGGPVKFHRNMAMYKNGFGRLRGDFWLGLDKIHYLTSQRSVTYKLHIDLEDWQGKRTFVEYRSFRVESEDKGYKLRIAHYSGNAGDSLTWHNNMMFTTHDVDNDQFDQNCADSQKGGWWYNSCAHSNLNGIYYKDGRYRSDEQDGIFWSDWRGKSYSLKSVAMMIRPIE